MPKEEKNELLGAVQKTMGEIQDLLQKSGYDYMNKEAPPMEEPPMEAPPAEGEPPMEEPPAEAPPVEGEMPAEEGGMGEEEMAAMVKELSDEELEEMLSYLMQEKDARTQTPAEGAPPEAPPMEAEKSMKDDFLKLSKSIEKLGSQLGTLTEDMKTLKTKPPVRVASKPAAANKPQVLEKSDPEPTSKQRLSKSESIEFMLNKKRENASITTDHITEMNLAKTQDEVSSLQDRLAKSGVVEFPRV